MTESFCPSGKETYIERSRAKMSAKRLKKMGKGNALMPNRKILRPYRCRLCGFWHLTSQGPQRGHK